jgi:hypothetical protein
LFAMGKVELVTASDVWVALDAVVLVQDAIIVIVNVK